MRMFCPHHIHFMSRTFEIPLHYIGTETYIALDSDGYPFVIVTKFSSTDVSNATTIITFKTLALVENSHWWWPLRFDSEVALRALIFIYCSHYIAPVFIFYSLSKYRKQHPLRNRLCIPVLWITSLFSYVVRLSYMAKLYLFATEYVSKAHLPRKFVLGNTFFPFSDGTFVSRSSKLFLLYSGKDHALNVPVPNYCALWMTCWGVYWTTCVILSVWSYSISNMWLEG